MTITIMGTLLAFGVGSFRSWALAKDHEGAAADLQTVLRQTQVRSITEGVSFCVTFDTAAGTYTVNRYACGTALQKVNGPFTLRTPLVRFAEARFTRADGSTTSNLTFSPNGTATSGQIRIERDGSPKTYTVAVEGFTGRVSTS